MVLASWVIGVALATAGPSQTTSDSPSGSGSGDLAPGEGWVRPTASDLRVLFRTSFKRDLGEFELLKTNEEEWTRPYISRDGARLFVGTRSGHLLALDPAEGTLLWRRRDMGTIGVGMAEFQDMVVVGSDSDLVAVDRATGKDRWRLDINGRIGGLIAVSGDLGIVPVRPNAFIAVGLATGEERWRVQRQTPDGITVRGQAPAAVDPQRKLAYLGFSDGAIAAVNTDDGGNRWLVQLGDRREFFADIDAKPIMVDGGKALLVASYNGGLARIDVETGNVDFKQDQLTRLVGLVPTGDGLAVGAYGDGQVLGIYPSDGRVRWRYRLRAGAPTAPVFLGDGYVMVGSTEGPITILRTNDGKPVQLIDLSSGVSVSPFHRRPHLAAMTNTGLLLVFRQVSNSQRTAWRP